MASTIEKIKQLREETAAGMMDVKRALEESEGDVEGARKVLRERGQALAAKKSGRAATEGLIEAYVHFNGRVGVLVEVNCETDFVARNEDFQSFVCEVASHVAAAAPLYGSEEEVPAETREAELKIFQEQAAADGKPPEVQEKIAEGRMRKWLEEVVLLNQTHVNEEKHESKTIEELRAELASSTGENVVIRRFARFVIGD